MARAMFMLMQLVFVGCAIAAPVTFKCTTAEGDAAADLIVDIERRTMNWGSQKYTIHAVDDRHISGYLNSTETVGGEVWVLNRVSGEYLRATIFIGWPSVEAARKAFERKDQGKISGHIYGGRCVRPLL